MMMTIIIVIAVVMKITLQVGTVFLWMFWPSFNAGAAAEGDAQMRAIVNTYYRWGRHRKTKSDKDKDKERQRKTEMHNFLLSLCSCAITTFAVSALLSPQKKYNLLKLIFIFSKVLNKFQFISPGLRWSISKMPLWRVELLIQGPDTDADADAAKVLI